jgi:hypothetical protein
MVWPVKQPQSPEALEQHDVSEQPFFLRRGWSPAEKKMANHFMSDTLPGLLQKGLIQRYGRNNSGTCIAVNGRLWKNRSIFFKQSLLAEILAYNTVHDYDVSTMILDSVSGKLYAQISPPAKVDIFD